MKYNYVQIGNNLRTERKKLNLSQENLLDNIREKGKPSIGRNTLSKIENGESDALNAISVAQLIALCEEFNCSISFLLGEYSYRNYDAKFICEATNLSESNLSKIIGTENDFLNAFIASKSFYNIDYSFSQMQEAAKRIKQCITTLQRLKEKRASLSKNDPRYQELDQSFSATISASERWEGEMYYTIYKMGIDFGNALEEIKNIILNKAPDTN